MKYLLPVLLAAPLLAQPPLDAAARRNAIDDISRALSQNYVFPETAKKMEAAIRERAARGEYDAVTNPGAFADLLTTHLNAIAHDKHLSVRPAPVGDRRPLPAQSAGNNGFVKVERLAGNIGYIDLRGFAPVAQAADFAAAAMTLVSQTDALIIDLRRNGGGDAEMVAYLCSYFFDKPVHVNSIYWRPTDKTTDHWTRADVPGRKYLAKPVYLLTSRTTFSGGEEFAYDLKNLKRATLVGETTGGGAHPVMFLRIAAGLEIGVPAGRAINPITKTNWEGAGVEPDVKTTAAEALQTATEAALAATSPSKPASGPAGGPVSSLPDTPAGRTLTAFMAAVNSGKIAEMEKFHADRGGSPENAKKDMGFYERTGGFTVVRVESSEPLTLRVRIQAKNGDELRLGITVEEAPPHGIAQLSLRGA